MTIIAPFERAFLQELQAKFSIKEMKLNMERVVTIKDQLAAFVAHDVKTKFGAMQV